MRSGRHWAERPGYDPGMPLNAAPPSRATLALWLALSLCARCTLAQPDETFTGVLERLGSADWYERQSATEALIASDDVPVSAIDEALRSGDLSPEQRARLSLVSVQRFRRESLAGLGVQFGNQGRGAVHIQAVIPGFPAAELLRAGDVILSVGEDLSAGLIGGRDDLRAEILSRRPGEIMPVLVRRGTRTIELDLPLGSYANLQGAAMLDDETIRAAMTRRSDRERNAAGRADPAVASGLDMIDWVRGSFPDGTWDGLTGGGERRDPIVVPGGPAGTLSARGRRSLLRTFWPGVEEALGEASRQVQDRVNRAMTDSIVLRGVYLEHERSLAAQIEQARAEGQDATALESSLVTLRAQLAALDRRLAAEAGEIDDILDRVERALEGAGPGWTENP